MSKIGLGVGLLKRIGPSFILIVGIVAQVMLTLVFVLTVSPETPGYAENMTIDGNAYLESARRMAEMDSWVFPPKTYHSVGHQMLVHAVTRASSTEPLPIKLFNVLCYVISLGLAYLVGREFGMSKARSLFAVFLLASSILVQWYCATIQYEIVALSLLLAALLFALRNSVVRFALVVGVICLFRLHLALAAVPLLWLISDSHGRRSAFRALFAIAGIVAFAWFAFFVRFESLRGFQGFPSLHDTRWLCREAVGWNFPYYRPSADSVCGVKFVTDHFLDYLELLGRRFTYWIGWRHDIWWVGGYPEPIDKLLIVANGVAVAFAAFSRRIDSRLRVLPWCIVFSALPFLLAGASTRFLVPVMPFILMVFVGVLGLVYDRLNQASRPIFLYS